MPEKQNYVIKFHHLNSNRYWYSKTYKSTEEDLKRFLSRSTNTDLKIRDENNILMIIPKKVIQQCLIEIIKVE